MPEAISVRPIY